MERQKITIDVVHDIVCSWCPIGLRNIQAALVEFDAQLDPAIRFLPYELNPDMGHEGKSIDSFLKARNGWEDSELFLYREEIVEIAARAGLAYDHSRRTHYWNTCKAHVLMHLAEKAGKQVEMNNALIHTYFTLGQNVSDETVLIEVAKAAGIVEIDLRSSLTSVETANEIVRKKDRVRQLGVQRVPTFVIDEREVVEGSNSPDFFRDYFSAYLSKRAA